MNTGNADSMLNSCTISARVSYGYIRLRYIRYTNDNNNIYSSDNIVATLTFIMSNSVFKTISIMMKYSKGVDTTRRHILYFMLFLSLGMYLSNGLACMVKSMQDFWNKRGQFSATAMSWWLYGAVVDFRFKFTKPFSTLFQQSLCLVQVYTLNG
jgi:hypothetical protein